MRIRKFRVYQVHNMADEFMIVSGIPQFIGKVACTCTYIPLVDIIHIYVKFMFPVLNPNQLPPKWVKDKCVSKCLNSSKTINAMIIFLGGTI